MRGLNKSVLFLLVLLAAASCGKKNRVQKEFYFTYRVAISNKITEPTIINGYYGTMNLYKGDFSRKDSAEAKKPVPSDFGIMLFDLDKKDLIEAAAYTKDGHTFYNLKKIKKADVEPKIVVIPNKHGFYQVDTNNEAYHVLICLNKRVGYYPGGLGTLNSPNSDLKMLEMKVDHQATF